jgi:hypothetical protein
VLPTWPGAGVAALAKVDETSAALNAIAMMPDSFKDFFMRLSFLHNWNYGLRENETATLSFSFFV